MGIPKRTHYGDYFHVRTKADPNNLAYTGAGLGEWLLCVPVLVTMSTHDPGLHTDLPYYRYTPGTQWLHCIQQTQVTTVSCVMCHMSRVTCHVSRVTRGRKEVGSRISPKYSGSVADDCVCVRLSAEMSHPSN